MFDLTFILLLLLHVLITFVFFVSAIVYFFVEARSATQSAGRRAFLFAILIFAAGIANALMMRYVIVFPKVGAYDLNSNSNLVINIISAFASLLTSILYLRTGQGFSKRSGMPGSSLLERKQVFDRVSWKWILLPIPLLILWTFIWFGLYSPEPTDLALATSPEGDSIMVYVYTFFTASIIAPVTEEILYRHLAMGLLARWFGSSKAAMLLNIGITSLIFAIAHAGVVTADWIKIVQILPAGFLFGWVNYRKGLEHAILSHSAFNTLVIPVALLFEHFATI